VAPEVAEQPDAPQWEPLAAPSPKSPEAFPQMKLGLLEAASPGVPEARWRLMVALAMLPDAQQPQTLPELQSPVLPEVPRSASLPQARPPPVFPPERASLAEPLDAVLPARSQLPSAA
jgi:hypothetical protein